MKTILIILLELPRVPLCLLPLELLFTTCYLAIRLLLLRCVTAETFELFLQAEASLCPESLCKVLRFKSGEASWWWSPARLTTL
nr:hypothetical protein Itr_chr12CG23470 [Ipomoea trifida]